MEQGTNIAAAAGRALERADPGRSLSVSPESWPAWADEAVGHGEANYYFDAEAAARGLSKAQRDGLPSLIATAERKMSGPQTADAAQLARRLELIVVRIQPTIADTAATAWAASLVASLSRIPADILAHAVAAAQYKQFEFASQVGPFIEAEAAEPLRQRRTQINRLREIELKARALPKPGEAVCSQEAAAAIFAEMEARQSKRARIASAAERPEIDWDAEREKKLADTNFLRALHGKPAFSMAEYQDDLALRHRKQTGVADELSDAIGESL